MTFRAVLVAAVFLPLALSAEPVVVVDREQVNIREDATTQSRRIEILHRGDYAEELLRRVGWIQIQLADGRFGWVHADLVQERYLVDGQGVRVRSGPTTDDGAVTMVYKGQELGKLGQRGDWINVQISDGRTGWIHKKFIRRKTMEDVRAVMPRESRPDDPGDVVEQPSQTAAEFDEPDPEFGVDEIPFALRRNPYAEGLQLEAAGDYGAALEQFEEVLAADFGNVNALYHAAQAQIQLGQLDEASKHLYRAIRQSGGRRDLYLTMSEVYRRRAMPDSAAKYEQLFSGEELTDNRQSAGEIASPEPTRAESRDGEGEVPASSVSSGEGESGAAAEDLPADGDPSLEEIVSPADDTEAGADRLHLFAIGSAALVIILVAAIWFGIRLGRGGESDAKKTSPPPPQKHRQEGTFSKVFDEESVAASEGRVTDEEQAELDRQIDDKWTELRQSSELFAPVEAGESGEEGQLNSILDHVEALREALDLQDGRATIYADVVRLQNMKIESMKEEIKLLRKRKRS